MDNTDRHAAPSSAARSSTAQASRHPSGSTALALVLAAASGYVDGIGVSYITGVFVSFMSGNTTNAGVALGTGDWSSLARVGATIPLYLIAVTLGALAFTRWARARPGIYAVVAALLAAFVLVASLVPSGESPDGLPELLLIALLVLPMGLLNMTLRRVGSTSVGLGYITGTLVSLGESLAALLWNRRRADWLPVGLFAGLWVCFFGGAAFGTFLMFRIGFWAALLPLGMIVVLLILDLRTAARHRPLSSAK